MKSHFLLATSLLLASTAHAAPLVIAGIAHDGSHKNAPLAGETVQLIRPGDNGSRALIATTRTDAAGKFQFPSRQYDPNDLLMANVPHQGYDYSVVAYDGGQKLKRVGINVDSSKIELLTFDTTNQPNGAKLDFQVHHLAIKSTPTGLHVIERIVVENLSNQTYLGFGPRKISVLLNIPDIAKNIRLDPKIQGKMLRTKYGWGVSMPITPLAYNTQNAIIFSYDVDWPSRWPWGKTVNLSREIGYPTKFFFVARETGDKEIKVDAPMLGPEGPQQLPVNGKTETRIVNSIGAPMAGGPTALKAGQMMDVKISRPVSNLFWGFAGLVSAMCLFLPVALLKPKRAERSHAQSVSSHTSARGGAHGDFVPLNGFAVAPTLTSSSRDLVQRIADLDDAFEASKIDEASYQSQRAAWKKQLIDSLASSPDEH